MSAKCASRPAAPAAGTQRTLYIYSQPWTVTFMAEEGMEPEDRCIADRRVIRVEVTNKPPSAVIDTLLHEVIHAVQSHREEHDSSEERCVRACTDGWMSLWFHPSNGWFRDLWKVT